jgi:response regulator RpfG family c-di-GMP phosphodiesterase
MHGSPRISLNNEKRGEEVRFLSLKKAESNVQLLLELDESKSPITVVHVDDDPEFLLLARITLELHLPKGSVIKSYESPQKLRSAISGPHATINAQKIDLWVIDHDMPHENGESLITFLMETIKISGSHPTIVMATQIDKSSLSAHLHDLFHHNKAHKVIYSRKIDLSSEPRNEIFKWGVSKYVEKSELAPTV